MSTQSVLEQTLTETFNPLHLRVENESHMHNVPPGSESHFKVTLVSEQVAGKNLVQRHRWVYDTLKEQMSSIHALALHIYTPDEWTLKHGAPASPQCMGGSKS